MRSMRSHRAGKIHSRNQHLSRSALDLLASRARQVRRWPCATWWRGCGRWPVKSRTATSPRRKRFARGARRAAEALERGATDEEIKKLMDELRAALDSSCRRSPRRCGKIRSVRRVRWIRIRDRRRPSRGGSRHARDGRPGIVRVDVAFENRGSASMSEARARFTATQPSAARSSRHEPPADVRPLLRNPRISARRVTSTSRSTGTGSPRATARARCIARVLGGSNTPACTPQDTVIACHPEPPESRGTSSPARWSSASRPARPTLGSVTTTSC